MQPQASRARIIIRTSLTPGLPQVVADERSLRQIVLNLIANSIKFTGPGGQVIVSTAFTDSREAVLRVRDTGSGMSEKDIAAALEPFRQTRRPEAGARAAPARPPADQGVARPIARISPSKARPMPARWSSSPSRRARAVAR